MSENHEIVKLAAAEELDIRKTFECGQCFRWNETEDLVYHGVAFGYPAKVWQEADEVFSAQMPRKNCGTDTSTSTVTMKPPPHPSAEESTSMKRSASAEASGY